MSAQTGEEAAGTAVAGWPAGRDELVAVQNALAGAVPAPWGLPATTWSGPVGGCWVCFPRRLEGQGAAGDPARAAAVVLRAGAAVAETVIGGVAGARYEAGLLALREGALLEAAVRAAPVWAALHVPEGVLLVNGSGRDHPRRAGLALHLGAVLDLPTVGVTHRPLVAEEEPAQWPANEAGAAAPLAVGGEVVAAWLRTRAGARPVLVHAAWRTDVETAVEVVRACAGRTRTPEPLRRARHLARLARAGSLSRFGLSSAPGADG